MPARACVRIALACRPSPSPLPTEGLKRQCDDARDGYREALDRPNPPPSSSLRRTLVEIGEPSQQKTLAGWTRSFGGVAFGVPYRTRPVRWNWLSKLVRQVPCNFRSHSLLLYVCGRKEGGKVNCSDVGGGDEGEEQGGEGWLAPPVYPNYPLKSSLNGASCALNHQDLRCLALLVSGLPFNELRLMIWSPIVRGADHSVVRCWARRRRSATRLYKSSAAWGLCP